MLFEKHTHHGNKDLIIEERVDRYGQIRVMRGKGFRHISIWEQFEEKKALHFSESWVENAQGEVVYRAKRGDTLKSLLNFRDSAYPGGSVCVWEGDEDGKMVFCDRPKPVQKPKSKKQKKASKKIRWP